MSESGLSPAIPWTDRLLLSVLFVSATVVAAYVAIVSVGGHLLPEALNELIYVVLGTTIVCLTVKHLADLIVKQLADLIVRRIDQMEQRQDRRLAAIHTALVQHGATLVEVTGEIPRIGLTPEVVDLGDRIARRLADN